MSEDSKTSGQPDPAGGNDQEQSKDSVQYATYARVLSEKKSEQAKRQALESQLKELSEKKLAEDNQFKDLYEKAKKERDEYSASLSQTKKQFAYQMFEKEAKQVAISMGVRPEAADDFIKVADFQGVEIDPDNFTVDQERLKEAVARTQKVKGYLFKDKAPSSPKDVTPGTGGNISGKTVGEMSSAEIEKLIKSGAYN
jgi:hypothetical protein